MVDRAKVLDLHQQGLSQWDISQRLGLSRASVGRIVAERTGAEAKLKSGEGTAR